MKSITFKIIRQGFIILAITSIIPRVIITQSYGLPNRDILLSNTVFFSTLGALIFAIVLTSLGLHHMLVKRIKAIQYATHQIEVGNLDVIIDMKGNDEISSLASSVNQMTKSLKRNDRQRDMFVKHVSHEMKTPLSLLKGYAELLIEEPLSKEGLTYANIIISESERLSKLSKNLLDLSMINTETQFLKREYIQLDVLIKEILLTFQLAFESKELTIQLDLIPVTIYSHQVYMSLMIKNLIDNAITYTPDQGEIQMVLNRKDDTFEFSITNKGTYLTKEELKHIHEPFYKGHQKSPLSSGIGLTLVKSATQQLGYTIDIDSDTQTYVCATLKIPNKENESQNI